METIQNRKTYVRSEIRQTLNEEVKFYRNRAKYVRTQGYATTNQICNLNYQEKKEIISSILACLF